MSTLASKLTTPCHFRADGVFCMSGYLHFSRPEIKDGVEYFRMIKVEDEPVSCSCCEGRGVILTDEGRELMTFFDTFFYRKVHEIAADYVDDKMGT